MGAVVRRRAGELLPLEIRVLEVAQAMRSEGEATFHGFGLAQVMQEGRAGGLIGHGTLYKALGRLEERGLLASWWEEPPPAGRPRRRLYELTAAGAQAAQVLRRETGVAGGRPCLAPGPA